MTSIYPAQANGEVPNRGTLLLGGYMRFHGGSEEGIPLRLEAPSHACMACDIHREIANRMVLFWDPVLRRLQKTLGTVN